MRQPVGITDRRHNRRAVHPVDCRLAAGADSQLLHLSWTADSGHSCWDVAVSTGPAGAVLMIPWLVVLVGVHFFFFASGVTGVVAGFILLVFSAATAPAGKGEAATGPEPGTR